MTVQQALAELKVALTEENAANAERDSLVALAAHNRARRNAAENAVSQAHTALEELARQV